MDREINKTNTGITTKETTVPEITVPEITALEIIVPEIIVPGIMDLGRTMQKKGHLPEITITAEKAFQSRSYQRDNSYRQGHTHQNSSPRYNNRVKAVETIDDIKADISRIEKEIELEIKEIKCMRLGL